MAEQPSRRRTALTGAGAQHPPHRQRHRARPRPRESEWGVDAPPQATTAPTGRPAGLAHGRRARLTGLLLAAAVLAALVVLSVVTGSKPIPPGTALDALQQPDGSSDHVVIRELRIPRTLLGLGVGAALGLSGACMQVLTRNPLAEPGLLGISSGAAAAVVVAVGLVGVTTLSGYIWFAFAGAALTMLVVYGVGAAAGRGGATPARLALAGIAVASLLNGFTSTVVLLDPGLFDRFRFWRVGGLAAADAATVTQVAPFLLVGILLALALAPALNTVALGDETARALGASLPRIRLLGLLTVTLLCGAATAAAGPIWFVGLLVPHAARAFTGADQRWVLAYSLLLAPILLLGADVAGRLVARPAELEAGIVTACLGGPLFVVLIRRWRMSAL